MALDFMAIVSTGTYPTAGVTTKQRAGYAVSWGLFGDLPSVVVGLFARGWNRLSIGLVIGRF